jgi:peptidoglycan/LPS O-acetylase OafA/YrhL
LLVAGVLVPLAVRVWLWSRVRPDLLAATGASAAFAAYLPGIFYPTYARFDGLMVGLGLAAIRVFSPELWRAGAARANRVAGAGLLTLGLGLAAVHARFSLAGSTVGFTLLALGFGGLVFAAAVPESLLNAWRIPGAETVSKLSYAIYLLHPLAFGTAAWVGGPPIVVAPVLIALFASALYALWERPWLRLRDRRFPLSRAPSSR